MTPAIAALVLGGVLIVAGIQGRNVIDVALGREGKMTNATADEALAKFGTTSADLGSLPSLTTTPQTGTGQGYDRCVSEMNRITSLHLKYVYGGGHAGYPANGPFDCSGAVSYVLHAAGLLKGPPRTSGLFMLWGQAGRGTHLTIYANAGHVFMVDEQTGRYWGTSRHNPGGGPGWHPARNDLANFTARHPPGL